MAGGGIKQTNLTVLGGADGATFIPYVDSYGNLSWRNNKGYPNPTTVNIKGGKGDKGDTGATGATGPKGDKGDTGNGCYVNGVATDINFTSNPQDQLNSLNEAINGVSNMLGNTEDLGV